jgi:hypothetical protein
MCPAGRLIYMVAICTLKASRKGGSQVGFGHFANLLPKSEAVGHDLVHPPRLGILYPSQSRKGKSRYGQNLFATFDD